MSLILKNHPKSRILSHIYVIMFVDYSAIMMHFLIVMIFLDNACL